MNNGCVQCENKPAWKVWSVNDCDWVVGRTIREAKRAYIKECGEKPEDVFDDPPKLMTPEQMARIKFVDTEDASANGPRTMTLQEHLTELITSGKIVPGLFGSTEY